MWYISFCIFYNGDTNIGFGSTFDTKINPEGLSPGYSDPVGRVTCWDIASCKLLKELLMHGDFIHYWHNDNYVKWYDITNLLLVFMLSSVDNEHAELFKTSPTCFIELSIVHKENDEVDIQSIRARVDSFVFPLF